MASSSKKGGKASVNASSFFDLKAELAKHEDAFAKSKLAGKGRAEPILGGVNKDKDKKPAVWARQNKGVRDRAQRDVELEQVSKPTLESARAALERKAQIYDKLQRGKGGGLSEKQREALLVDFDDRYDDGSSSGSDRDESLIVPRPPNREVRTIPRYQPNNNSILPPRTLDHKLNLHPIRPTYSNFHQPDDPDDPIVEYEDEFGRIRTARRSDVPRDRLPESTMTSVPADDEYVPASLTDLHCANATLLSFEKPRRHGRATHFPVYEPTAEKRAEVEESLVESSPFARYDASKDNRAMGAGFYQFSADEETRAREMEELKRARVDTVLARAEVEAEDGTLAPEEGGAGRTGRSRAVEKRRKELDERRQMLEAKRRKMLGGDDDRVGTGGAEDFLASLEKDLLSAPTAA